MAKGLKDAIAQQADGIDQPKKKGLLRAGVIIPAAVVIVLAVAFFTVRRIVNADPA